MPTTDLGRAHIAYDTFGSPDAEPLLMIQGLGVQMIGWRPEFIDELVARGFYVIRFDNRDIGLSSRHPAPFGTLVKTLLKRRLGLQAHTPYRLGDMALDALGLLDHLGVERAHLVGVSMGGMIAQTMAIRFPDRVRSLCSMMSCAFTDLELRGSWRTAARLAWLATHNHPARMVDRQVELLRTVGSKRYFDETEARAQFERAVVRASDRSGVPRQLGAVLAAKDRRPRLRGLQIPTTVVHGSEDPLIPPAAGRATADAIVGARWNLIEHLGHDLPEALFPRFASILEQNAARAHDRPIGRLAPLRTDPPAPSPARRNERSSRTAA